MQKNYLDKLKQRVTKAFGKEPVKPPENPPELVATNHWTIPYKFGGLLSSSSNNYFPSLEDHESMLNSLSISTLEFEEELRRIREEFSKLTTVSNATRFTIGGCKTCTHSKDHHNPDKRMSSGFGMCICRKCRKYEEPYLYANYIDVTTHADNFTRYINIPNSGHTFSTTSTSNYWEPYKPTYSVSLILSDLDIISSKSTNYMDIVLDKLRNSGIDTSKIRILSYNANQSASSTQIEVQVTYREF